MKNLFIYKDDIIVLRKVEGVEFENNGKWCVFTFYMDSKKKLRIEVDEKSADAKKQEVLTKLEYLHG